MPNPNQIPSNPEIIQTIHASGANALPTGETQGRAAEREAAPVIQNDDSDSKASDFWGALINESETPESAFDEPQERPTGVPNEREVTPNVVNLTPEIDPILLAPPAQAPAQSGVMDLQQQMNALNQNVQNIQQQVQPKVDNRQLINQAVDYLANNNYKMTPEQSEMMITEPEKIFPVMAAQMHVQLIQDMAQQISQQIRQQVPQMMKSEQAAANAEREFYGKYPGLQNKQYESVVTNSIRLVKQLNPNANRTQVMDLAASAAAQTLRQAGYGNVGQPQGQANAFGGQQPYSPAAATVSSAQPPVLQKQQNIWSELSDDPSGEYW